jgi:ribosomal-protein-alanine N-acetyltransferase
MRYWSTPPHGALEEAERWVAISVEAAERGSAIELAVEHEGALIGRVGFWRPEEIGFLFFRRAWGHGFGREAVARAASHAFEVTTWPEIRADVDPRNVASLRLLERVGFRETGRAEKTYLVGGEWAESVYLRLGRETGHSRPGRRVGSRDE